MDDKRATISSIANEVGVSTTTVSRFLSGQYQYMSKNTREKIRIAIQRHNYRPSLVARGLKSSKSYLIGVVMHQVHMTASSLSLRGVCMACNDTIYSPIIVSIENNNATEEQKIQELLDHRVDGILTFTGSGDTYYRRAVEAGVPVVRVDRCEDSPTFDSVSQNHYEVVQDALLNLTVSGFNKIAIFINKEAISPYSTLNTRLRAYHDFIAKNDGLEPIEYSVDTNHTYSLRNALTHFMAAYPDDRKAIFVPSVEDLSNVHWACQLMGLRYPKDLAILGYVVENDPMAAAAELSVISQPVDLVCREALNLLISRVSGEDLGHEAIHRVIPATLTIRRSTLL